jgi:subtilase family serine protease
VNGQEIQVGGTSAVAPLYAGLFAAFGQKLGFVTPKLWQNPDAFVDITQGGNGSFHAAVGPDPCTGLGVPNGPALAALFASRARRASR